MVRTKKWRSEPCGLQLTSQSLRTVIVVSQFSLCHWSLRNLTLHSGTLQITRDFFRLQSTFARLYNAAALPASRLRSGVSLSIFFYCCALCFLIADDVRNCFRQCGDKIEIRSTPRTLHETNLDRQGEADDLKIRTRRL